TLTGSGSTDADDDDLTYEYKFENDVGTVQDWSEDDSYTIDVTDAHNTITVYTRTYDGEDYSDDYSETDDVDNTAPTAPTDLDGFPDNLYVGDTLTVTGSGSEDADEDGLTYEYKFENDVGTVQDWSEDDSYTIGVTDAHNTITVYTRTYDGEDYSNEYSETDDVDNTAPVIAINSPNGGENWKDANDITWTATDADEDTITIDLQYNIDGAGWIDIVLAESDDGIYEWDTNSAGGDSNNYLINSIADDGYGGIVEDQSDAVFTVDNTIPEVGSININPRSGSYTASSFEINAPVSDPVPASGIDVASCEFTIDGTTWGEGTYDDTTTPLCKGEGADQADGTTINANIRVMDNAGNQETGSQVTITVDAVPPQFESFDSPDSNDAFSPGESIIINIPVSDTKSGIDNDEVCWVEIDGTLLGDVIKYSEGACSGTVVVPEGITQGNNDLIVKTVDNVGLEGTSTPITINIQSEPSGTPTLKEPADSSTVDSSPTLKWNAVADANDYLLEIADNIGFTSPITIEQEQTSYPTDLDDGTYYWHVAARDSSLNLGQYSSTWSFTINPDTEAPAVAITSPAGGTRIDGTVDIEYTVTDDGDILSEEIKIDGNAWETIEEGSPYLWDTTSLNDGTHTVQIRATDDLGNIGYSSTLIYTVDNTPGFVSFIYPNSGECLNDDTFVTVDVPDNTGYVEFADSSDCGLSVASDSTYFEHSDYGTEVDCLEPDVCLFRDEDDEAYSIGDNSIEWAVGQCGDEITGYYPTLKGAMGYDMEDLVDSYICLHIKDTDTYWEIEWASWTSGKDGGGFAYTRTHDNYQIDFTHSDWGSEIDCIEQDVCLFRDYKGDIYNRKGSVLMWAMGECGEEETDYYNDLKGATDGNMDGLPGEDTCLHILDSDTYWDIYWDDWADDQDGGGFSYTRTNGQTEIEFTHEDFGYLADCIEPDVCLFRDYKDSIYVRQSPVLMWAMGQCGDEDTDYYNTLKGATGWDMASLPEKDTCLFVPDSGNYWDISWDSWANGADGGGFAYTRIGSEWTTTWFLGSCENQGQHTLTATAYYENGDAIDSDSVSVNVDHSAPNAPSEIVNEGDSEYDDDGSITWRWNTVSDNYCSGVAYYELNLYYEYELLYSTKVSDGGNVDEMFHTFTDLENGEYYTLVRSVDNFGYQSDWTGSDTVIVDKTAPKVTSVSLDLSQYTPGAAITITVTATDDEGVISVTADNIELTNVDEDEWSGTITAETETGLHNIEIIASDAAGSQATDSITYEVIGSLDVTPPTISIESPSNGNYVIASITISGTADDETELDGVEVSTDGSTWEDAAITDTAWEYPWDISELTDGSYTIAAKAIDTNGNEETAYITVTLDQSAPILSIMINNGEGYTSSEDVTLTLTATDATSGLDECRFSNDDETWSEYGDFSPTKSWDLSEGDGKKTVYYECDDIAGNTGTAQDTITLDTTEPTIDGLSPMSGSTINTGSFNLIVDTSEEANCRYSQFGVTDFDDMEGRTAKLQDNIEHKAGINGLDNGDYTFTIVCVDLAGLSSDVSTLVISVDKQAPTVIDSTPENGFYNEGPEITVTTDEDAICRWGINDASMDNMPEANEFETQADIPEDLIGTTLKEGVNAFYIRCKDSINNEMDNSALIIFTYDTEKPQSSVAVLQEYGQSTEITLTWSGSDSSGISSYNLQESTDGEEWDSIGTFDANTLSTTITRGEGTYYYLTIAIDNAGNEESKDDYDQSTTIDTTEPDSLSISINDGAAYTNSVGVILSLGASDDNLDSVTCRFSNDGEEWSAYEDYAETKSWVLETQDAEKTVYYQCKDGAENTADPQTDTIILDATAPQITKTEPNDTITDSTPTLRITTDQQAECEFRQDAEFDFGKGLDLATEDGLVHEYDLTLPLDREYLFYVKCRDQAVNMDETVVQLNLDTRGSYSIVRPDSMYGYWLPGFRTFTLSRFILGQADILDGDYSVDNVLSSISGNYNALYYKDEDGTLLIYLPGLGGSLTEFIDETGYIPYYINIKNKDRLEIN
ncbi:MAG: Ig-like domain-containing protein, partial [Nanoarchaeota archaeon]